MMQGEVLQVHGKQKEKVTISMLYYGLNVFVETVERQTHVQDY